MDTTMTQEQNKQGLEKLNWLNEQGYLNDKNNNIAIGIEYDSTETLREVSALFQSEPFEYTSTAEVCYDSLHLSDSITLVTKYYRALEPDEYSGETRKRLELDRIDRLTKEQKAVLEFLTTLASVGITGEQAKKVFDALNERYELKPRKDGTIAEDTTAQPATNKEKVRP